MFLLILSSNFYISYLSIFDFYNSMIFFSCSFITFSDLFNSYLSFKWWASALCIFILTKIFQAFISDSNIHSPFHRTLCIKPTVITLRFITTPWNFCSHFTVFRLLTSTCSPSIFPHSDSSSKTESTHTLHSFLKLSLHSLYHFYLFLSSALFLHLFSTSTLFLPYSHSYSLCCKWKPVFRNSLITAFTHFHSIYHMNFDWDSLGLRK